MIDSSIPLRVNQLNLAEVFRTGQQLEQGRMQNRLAQMQMEEAQRQQKQQEQVNALMPQAMQRDQNALNQVTALDPEMGFKLIDQFAKMDEAQREQIAFTTDMIGRAALNSRDDASWNANIDRLVALGVPDVEQYRGKFSPELRQQAINEAQTVKDAISQSFQREKFGAEQEWKGREFQADQAHRGAQLGIQQGQLSVSQQRLAADQAHREAQLNADYSARQERMGIENEKLKVSRIRAEKGPMRIDLGGKSWDDARSKGIEASLVEMDEAAKSSRAQVDTINRMQQLMKSVKTGPWEANKLRLQKGLQSMGIDPSIVGDISGPAELDALGKRLVLDIQQTQVGVQTEGDRMYMQQSTAGLGNPEETNKNLLNWSKSRAEIDNMLARQANKVRTMGNFDEAATEFNRIKELSMSLPAATVIQDTPITFSEFADAMKQNGYSDEQALAEWAKRVGNAPANP